jgi:hypothetical protein
LRVAILKECSHLPYVSWITAIVGVTGYKKGGRIVAGLFDVVIGRIRE